jgi:parallel beta-helix repeat protein
LTKTLFRHVTIAYDRALKMGGQRAALILLLILCFSVVSISKIRIVKAEGTIYIRADGSVEGTDNIQRDGNVYTFTESIVNQSIVVEKNNTVIDGVGYTLEGTGDGNGVRLLEGINNVTVKNFEIMNFEYGIYLAFTTNSTIKNNNLTNNVDGITLWGANNNIIIENYITNSRGGLLSSGIFLAGSYNFISKNNITANQRGIYVSSTSTNNIVANNIVGNTIGILFDWSDGQIIYHNNFINNPTQAVGIYWGAPPNVPHPPENHTWDNGYEGNYWSNYNGTDNDGNGIGDIPHILNWNNQDNYPLMNPVDITEIPEFSLGTLLLVIMFALTITSVIYKRKLVNVKCEKVQG